MYFDIEAHRHCFQTKESEAYFWHGQTNNVGGPNNAKEIADKNHGKTLEMHMLEHRAELEKSGVRFRDLPDKTVDISYGSNQIESNKFWEDCSKTFAEQASGNVHVIEGTDLRPNGQQESDYPSVYNRIEHPALIQNENVQSITLVNPSNGETTGCEHLPRQFPKSSYPVAPKSSANAAPIDGGGARAPSNPRDIDFKTDLGVSNDNALLSVKTVNNGIQ